jgi:hypothetical protein
MIPNAAMFSNLSPISDRNRVLNADHRIVRYPDVITQNKGCPITYIENYSGPQTNAIAYVPTGTAGGNHLNATVDRYALSDVRASRPETQSEP